MQQISRAKSLKLKIVLEDKITQTNVDLVKKIEQMYQPKLGLDCA